MTVTVDKSTIFENVHRNFYDLITAISGFSSIVYAEFPSKVLDAKGDYPIVIVNPADVNWDTFTFGKNLLEGTIDIDIYTTTPKECDEKSSDINIAIENGKDDLATVGLRQVNLSGTTNDMIPQGKIKVHVRTLTFAYKFYFDKTQAW